MTNKTKLSALLGTLVICLNLGTVWASIAHAQEQESIPLADAAGETADSSAAKPERKQPLLHWSGYEGVHTFMAARELCISKGGRLPTVSEFNNDGLLLYAGDPTFLKGWDLPYWMESDSRSFRDSVPVLNKFQNYCSFKSGTCERIHQDWGGYTTCILPN